MHFHYGINIFNIAENQSSSQPPHNSSCEVSDENDTSNESQCQVKLRCRHVLIPGCRNRNASYLTLALDVALIGEKNSLKCEM